MEVWEYNPVVGSGLLSGLLPDTRGLVMRCAVGLLGGCLLLLCVSSRIARGDERPFQEEIDRLIEAKSGKTAIVGHDLSLVDVELDPPMGAARRALGLTWPDRQ